MTARKRHKSRIPPTLFAPGMGKDGWSKFDTWLRTALELYLRYPEVTKQKLSADGRPEVDTFTRPRPADDAPPIGDDVKWGAVWFTRQTLRTAWFMVFGQSDHRFDKPAHYVVAGKGRSPDQFRPREQDRTYTNYSHPMDQYIPRMVKDGRLVSAGRNKYMLAEPECTRLEMPEAWRVHTDRGFRWEGLTYEKQKMHASEVDRRGTRRVRESNDLLIYRPTSHMKGKRHPNERHWERVYEGLARYMYFDRNIVLILAKRENSELNNMSTATTHISRWLKLGKIKKVFPRLYQSVEFEGWFLNRPDKAKQPLFRETSSWFFEYLRYWCPLQYKMDMDTQQATSYFTSAMIFDHFSEGLADSKTERWMKKHLPDGLSQATISTLLTGYKKAGYVERAPTGFRATREMMKVFAPLWTTDIGTAISRSMNDIHRFLTISIDESIHEITRKTSPDAIYVLMNRISRDHPDGEFKWFVGKIADKMGSTPTALLNSYRAHMEATY